MKRRKRRKQSAGWFCVTLLMAPTYLWAAQWSAQPWADARLEYNSNVRLRTGNPEAVMGGVLNAGLNLKRADERGYLRLTPSLRSTEYDSDKSLSSNDQMLRGEWNRNGERSAWQLIADWTRDTTLTSELDVSGLVQTRKRRLMGYIAPSFSYSVSPRDTLSLSGGYTAVEYENAQFTGLVDYNYASAELSWARQWSERISVTGVIYGTRLDAGQIGNRTDTTGAQVRLHAALNERWNSDLSTGLRHSDGKGITGQDADGWLASLRLSREDQLGEWGLLISRSVDPSGTGALVQRDQWSLTREQALTERLRLSVSGQWSINQDLQPLAASRDRDYRSAFVRLSHRLTPTWSIQATYAYAWQEYAGALDQAERHAVMLGVSYYGVPVTE